MYATFFTCFLYCEKNTQQNSLLQKLHIWSFLDISGHFSKNSKKIRKSGVCFFYSVEKMFFLLSRKKCFLTWVEKTGCFLTWVEKTGFSTNETNWKISWAHFQNVAYNQTKLHVNLYVQLTVGFIKSRVKFSFLTTHSLNNLIPRFALLRLAALGLRKIASLGIRLLNSLGQKTKFHSRQNGSHCFLHIQVNKNHYYS